MIHTFGATFYQGAQMNEGLPTYAQPPSNISEARGQAALALRKTLQAGPFGSQKELARAAHYRESTVSQYFSGNRLQNELFVRRVVGLCIPNDPAAAEERVEEIMAIIRPVLREISQHLEQTYAQSTFHSVAELAEKIGVGEDQIQDWLRGGSRPDDTEIERFVRACLPEESQAAARITEITGHPPRPIAAEPDPLGAAPEVEAAAPAGAAGPAAAPQGNPEPAPDVAPVQARQAAAAGAPGAVPAPTAGPEGGGENTQTGAGRKRWLTAAVAVGALLFATVGGYALDHALNPVPACGADTALAVGKGDGVLKFGLLHPTSGPLAAQGPQLRAGVELAQRDVLAAEGVPGINVVETGPDSELDEGAAGSGKACESAGTLLAAGADVIVGPTASANSLAVLDRVTQAGGVLVSPASTAPELSATDIGRFYRTVPSDVIQGRVLAAVVAAEGNQRVAIVARDDAYGQGLKEQALAQFRGLGIGDTLAVAYPGDEAQPEFSGVVERLTTYRPDAVVIVGYDEVAGLLRQMIGARLGPADLDVYGTDGFMRQTLPLQVAPGRPEALAGLRGTTLGSVQPDFDQRLLSEFPSLQDTTYTAQAYDAIIISALAAAAAGSDDPRVFTSEMGQVTQGGTLCTKYESCIALLKKDRNADIAYAGPSGQLALTGTGDPCVGNYRIARFDTAGKLQQYRTGAGTNLCIALSGPS